ncbi:MAG: hypothetical protein QW717_07295 [Candidatus Bathyarchaeia archaeon]
MRALRPAISLFVGLDVPKHWIFAAFPEEHGQVFQKRLENELDQGF